MTITASGKILFICTGNTCRSPMAEGIFKALNHSCPSRKASSAGIAATTGSPASKETLEILRCYGIDLTCHLSRLVSDKLLKEAEVIFTMTNAHLAVLLTHFPQHAHKMHLVTEGTTGKDIPDPIGCGKRAYEQVAIALEEAISSILSNLSAPQKRSHD